MGVLSKIFGVGDVVGSLERVASEFIETDMESAEAKSLFIKTLDPNGLMRRQLSSFACRAYGGYLVIMVFLSLAHASGLGESAQTKEAMDAIVGLFLPITGAWSAIVAASFGVNISNTIKGK